MTEIVMKLVDNAVATGGHIVKGKPMSNRIIDLQVCAHLLVSHRLHFIFWLLCRAKPASTERNKEKAGVCPAAGCCGWMV